MTDYRKLIKADIKNLLKDMNPVEPVFVSIALRRGQKASGRTIHLSILPGDIIVEESVARKRALIKQWVIARLVGMGWSLQDGELRWRIETSGFPTEAVNFTVDKLKELEGISELITERGTNHVRIMFRYKS